MILAIDDDSGRFDGLRRMLEPRGVELRVACCCACVNDAVLHGVKAVLLDYDLDSGDPCSCGEHLPEFDKGTRWVEYVAKLAVPVLVTSASYVENVDRLCAMLRIYMPTNVPHARVSAHEIMPEDRWISKLWQWGVL